MRPRLRCRGPMRRRLSPILFAAFVLAATACDHFAAARASAPPVASLTPAPHADARAGSPCEVVNPGPSVTIETITAADGTCVPPSRVVVYRCDPGQPQLAVADIHDSPTRFLGGVYAVPVDGLPVDARPIGVTGSGRIWTTAGDRALYVEAGGSVERWLALPNAATVASPTAFMVGDSILDGGRDAVVAGLQDWDVTIDALIGRGSVGGIAPAESITDMPNVAVVELGVNDLSDTTFAANAERILAAVHDADLVVWVTAHGPEPVTDQIDRTIVADIGGIPNGAILDWNRLVPPDLLGSDGVHPTTGQEDLLASFLDPFLVTWRDAVEGRGPAACQGDVETVIGG
jgi:hypothetical protein